MWKWTKRIVLTSVACTVLGVCFFGSDALSYMTSSGRMISAAVKDAVPIEFEIKRARNLLEELVPETHANLKLVAQEEVEVTHLERELEREHKAVATERGRIAMLRRSLNTQQVSYRFGNSDYTRIEVVDELSRRFEHLRTAELLVAGKEKLLSSRKANLRAAIQKLEKTRLARLQLAAQIESLESQFRLVQAQGTASEFSIDNSKLSQTQRLIVDLRKRLEVAQKVLAREARFVENIPVDSVNEKSLLETIDDHFEADYPADSSSVESSSAAY